MNLFNILITTLLLLITTTASAQQPQWAGLFPADFHPIFPKEGDWTIDLHTLPDENSEKLGQMKIQFRKRGGFHLSYWPTTDPGTAIEFKPDLYDSDYGYGPDFHQTVLSVNGDWVLLPKNPLQQKAWANLTKTFGSYDLKTIDKGGIYTLDGRSIFVIQINKDSITLRDEQKADMWCEDGESPPLKKFSPENVPFHNLYDEDKHLKLHDKYTRGC